MQAIVTSAERLLLCFSAALQQCHNAAHGKKACTYQIMCYVTYLCKSVKHVSAHILSIARWSAGANVRQQHSLNHGITLYFDVQLQWAVVYQQATICIQADTNHNWTAQQVVESSRVGQQIHTVQVATALPCRASLLIGSLNMPFMHLHSAEHDFVAKVSVCYAVTL